MIHKAAIHNRFTSDNKEASSLPRLPIAALLYNTSTL
jgi:hypothetical protein